MAVSRENLRFAVRNVAQHGDTDVFPYPLENHWFHDKTDAVVALLEQIDAQFDDSLRNYPVLYSRSLSAVGHLGFRAATQIDPIWNAYLLALVLEIADEIEMARIGKERGVVFSYRFMPDREKFTLFDPDSGWGTFQRTALSRVSEHDFVLTTDISDFYARVYHHRLENALHQASKNTEVNRRICAIISALAPGGVSYGLPVGGHAARVLAELVLNRTDRLLTTRGIKFCRFVDDFHIFASSREEAHAALVYLSDILLNNDGLTLSRAKTRFMSRSEFQRLSPVAEPAVAESLEEHDVRRFISIRLRYDPYSATAEDDYEALREQLEAFDITGMLAREIRKSRIDELLVRQLVKSLRFVDASVRDSAVLTLVQNLTQLYPVFPTVTILLRASLNEISDETRSAVTASYRELVASGSHITLVPANMAFALRLIALDSSDEVEPLLASVYDSATDTMIKRDIILAMVRRRADYWLSDLLKRYAVVSPWEKRALIVASYVLGDEGKTWRERMRVQLSTTAAPVEAAFKSWVGEKNSGRTWEVPL